MAMTARAALAALVLLGSGLTAKLNAADEPGVEAKAAFDRLKTLAGEWKAEKPTEHGDEHKEGKVIYKVTAAGSALVETQFPGAKHEMVSVYHLDGKNLLMTHYCAAGNQPRLKLDLKASKPDNYVFVFDGGTNLNPDKDMHIHGLRIRFLEGGKVESEWDGYMDGKKTECVKIPLSRM